MNTYSLSDEATQDLENICDYIAQNHPKAASKIFDEIRQRAKLLAQFPNMGKPYDCMPLI
jgi:toxin ParE1/3/4